MAINTSLLIASPTFQDVILDPSTGLPAVDGQISMFIDNNRTTFKNWYYQTGAPGNYTYITLPNPLTLGSAGNIVDVNGNDVIPFFYPFDENDNVTPQAYFVQILNSNGQLIKTLQNFPFVNTSANTISNPTNENLIVNNVFWRHVTDGRFNSPTTIVVNGVTLKYITLVPSQHDGYIMPDICYFKNTTDATDVVTFPKFTTDNVLTNDVTPEFYCNVKVTGAGTETIRYIQIPVALHIDNLSGYANASFSIWTQNPNGLPANTISVKLFQFTGTGTTSPTAETLTTIIAGVSWQKTTVDFAFPSSQGLTIGGGGDDAWFIQLGFPTSTLFELNFAKPSLYLSPTGASNDLEIYDKAHAIFDAPRTGDIVSTLNNLSRHSFGWVAMNDGTIGNASSNASLADISTWPLFNLIWSMFSAYNNGTTNNIAQMFNSSGVAIAYGASAIADFNANNRISLTKQMGRVLMGTVPQLNYISATNSQTFTASNSAGTLLLTITSTSTFYKGQPVVFTVAGGALATGLASNDVFYIGQVVSPTTLFISTSFANAMAGTYIAFTDSGSGTQTITNSVTGTYNGEYAHTQLVGELATHNHPGSFVQGQDAAGGSTQFVRTAASQDHNVNLTIANQGSSTPFNVVQPSVYLNIFMKL